MGVDERLILLLIVSGGAQDVPEEWCSPLSFGGRANGGLYKGRSCETAQGVVLLECSRVHVILILFQLYL